ncbi:MAG: hypothetical protein AVDCRST_MAG85-637, partial [uncultured Solirubrobacteraceae bacterium]
WTGSPGAPAAVPDTVRWSSAAASALYSYVLTFDDVICDDVISAWAGAATASATSSEERPATRRGISTQPS